MKGLPKKPVIKWGEVAKLSWDERNCAIRDHEAANKAYKAEIVKYVNEKGAKGLPMNRIRTFFEAERILNWGGRRILEYRWERYVKGHNVARTDVSAYYRPLPTFTLFDRQSSMVFSCGDLRCIPLDVLGMHLLPSLDVCSLFNLMYSCKQFQALAHRELLCRAKKEFGEFGTPMALRYKDFDPAYAKHRVKTYQSVDNWKTLPQYQALQVQLREVDFTAYCTFMREDFDFVNGIVKKTLGEAFGLKRLQINHLIKCEFLHKVIKVLFKDCATQILRLSSKYGNTAERSEKRISEAVLKHAPSANVRALLDIVVSTHIGEYVQTNTRTYCDNFALLLQDLANEANARGIDWAEKVLRKAYAYGAMYRTGTPRFSFDDDENDVSIKLIKLC